MNDGTSRLAPPLSRITQLNHSHKEKRMSANLTTEPSAEKSPRRKGRIRRVLKRVFYLIIVLIGGFAIYAWATGARQEPIDTGEPHMKAVVYTNYGSPDVLEIRDVKKPTPNDDQVLVKVRAASLNPLDWHFMEGTPYIMRALGAGLRKPKDPRLGVDLAGEVEAVGKNVTQFKPGDEVFGTGHGAAFAEYVCAGKTKLALKPATLTFEQAAAVPVAALTALQGLRDKGKVQPGQKVLINGASGGVGTFAVQIAKSFGAEVTGVCSTRNVDMVRSIGADHVIDYTKEDFTKTDQRYDLIFDLVGNHSFSERRRILNRNGICVMAGIGGAGWHDGMAMRLAGELNAYVRSRFVSEKFISYIAQFNKKDMMVLADLMQSGKVTPVIDRTYKLSDVPEALRYLEQGHARGKVVIAVE